MPELPEVEVTRRGIAPFLEGRSITGVVQRRSGLRWPFPAGLERLLTGQRVVSTGRRGKYLLIHFAQGTLKPSQVAAWAGWLATTNPPLARPRARNPLAR